MTLDVGEGPGDRPIVGAVTGWLCTRPFLIDVVAFNLDRRVRTWSGYAARARKVDDEARQWAKVVPEDAVRIVVKESEHGQGLKRYV